MRSKNLSLIPLVVVAAGLAVLLVYFYPEPIHPPVFSFELPYPFSFAHSVFLSVSVLVAAYFFGRGFLAKGSVGLLALGGGSLVLGLGFLLSQILGNRPFGGPNQLVGVSTVSFLMSGIFYLAFVMYLLLGRGAEVKKPSGPLFVVYALGVVAVVATILVFETGLAPVFIAPGVGPTPLREQMLGLAALLYAVTSATLMWSYSQSKNGVLYWFSLGLGAVTIGFVTALFGKLPGSLYSWLGRISLELGGIYIILAILRAYRGDDNQALPRES